MSLALWLFFGSQQAPAVGADYPLGGQLLFRIVAADEPHEARVASIQGPDE